MNEYEFKTVLRAKIADIGSVQRAADEWGVRHPNIRAFLKGDLNTGKSLSRAPPGVLIGVGYRKIKHIRYEYEERIIYYTYEKAR